MRVVMSGDGWWEDGGDDGGLGQRDAHCLLLCHCSWAQPLRRELERWIDRKVTALRINKGADRWEDQLGK